MTPRIPRRDGWLWPAVLVVSAALLVGAGHQLLAPPGVAADVPVSTAVADPEPTPAPSPSATPAPREQPAARWPTRSAAPRPAPKVVAPERLVAQSVGLDLPVVPQGVDGRGQMDLPERPTQLGWYRFGPTPADRRGAVVLAGHVDSDRYGTGPLVRAAQLRRGDRVEVRDASGRTTTYAVVAVQRIRKADFSPDDVFARAGKPVLRLITCSGPYLPARGGYQDNLVVTAERR
ncbi:sortase domain-containing protein [Microlunatus flavus]|uniref:Sortase family protein n=1 Tax=Microlunatus flavus TaxID=1036181 RepID=A0A1H9N484_9ACTN|nr:sortase [Microlunatus flavus]SER30688.1 Sortase family protein [Microlunatus flavus]